MKDVILTPEGYEQLKSELDVLRTTKRRGGRRADRGRARVRRDRRERRVRRREERADDARAPDRPARGAPRERARDRQRRTSTRASSRSAPSCACGTSTPRRPIEYFIVGSAEANPAEQKLSNESPVGKAIMGRKKGETVEVVTPRGSSRSSRSWRSRPPSGRSAAMRATSGVGRWTPRSASASRHAARLREALPRPRTRSRTVRARGRAARGRASEAERAAAARRPRHGAARTWASSSSSTSSTARGGSSCICDAGRSRARSTSTSATSSASSGMPGEVAARRAVARRRRARRCSRRTRSPLPDTFHGLTDVELRYRKRYLDLLMNEETRELLPPARAMVVSAIRRYLDERGLRRGRDADPAAPLRRRLRATRSSRTRTSSTPTSTCASRPSSTSSG